MQRRPKIVFCACLVAVAGFIGLAFWFVRNTDSPQPDTQAHPSPSAPTQAVTASVRSGSASASYKLTHLTAANISKLPDAAAVPQIDDGTACGLDQIKSTIDSGKLPPHVVAAARETIEKVASQLEVSRIEQERALGLLLQAKVRGEAALDQYRNVRPNCDKDADCPAKAVAARQLAALPQLELLAQLAATAADPASYAAAFYQCGSRRTPGCAAITATRWAAMDPTNAVPWLHVAIAADVRNDSATRDEAMVRASTLPLYDMRQPGALRLMQNDLVRTQPVPVRLAISQDLLNTDSSDIYAPYVQMTKFCSPQANPTPEKLKTCGQLAEKLIQQDHHFLGQRVAAGIAEMARWPAERVADLNDEYYAMAQVSDTLDVFPTSHTNCRGYEKFEIWMSEATRIGYVAVLRQAIGASGKSIATLAGERRDAQAKVRERTEKANVSK